jgi:cytochrome c-type biogenesis protein CcmE
VCQHDENWKPKDKTKIEKKQKEKEYACERKQQKKRIKGKIIS